MAVYGDISHDSRVQREAAALSDAGHAVTVYCLAWAERAAHHGSMGASRW